MTVGNLQRYLDELLSEDRKFDTEVVAAFKSKAEDWLDVSEDELKFLAETVLHEHADRFATEAARQDLGRFLVQQVQSKHYPWEPFLKLFNSIPGLSNCLIGACLGQVWQIFKDGSATPEDIRKVRQNSAASEFRGTASLAKIDPKCHEKATIEAALSKAIHCHRRVRLPVRAPPGAYDSDQTWSELGRIWLPHRHQLGERLCPYQNVFPGGQETASIREKGHCRG
jgi:hypothetical protein